MNRSKVIKIEEDALEFDSGIILSSYHAQD